MSALIETTGDIITFVLRASGINGQGQTPSAEDSNTGLQMLYNLLAQWQRKRWLTIAEDEVSVPASTGALFYTIGPACDFDYPRRVVSLKAAYIRILTGSNPNLVDLPLDIVRSREEYAQVSVKTLQTIPAIAFLDTQWPTGRIYFWPVPPASQYGLFVTVQQPLPRYATLTDPLNLPDEYLEALQWSLCVRLQMSYGLPANPNHVAAMNQALAVLRTANAQIPELGMPSLGRHRSDVSLVGPGLGRAFILDQGAVL